LNGDMINLKVRPEVSALDFSSALTLNGFRVPALSTRRTETEVELANGQTFAIAGLMNNTVTNTMRSIPGIGDIPILGWLFKSKAMAKNQTELVVMITPTIVRKGSMGVSEGVPSAIEPYLGAPKKTLPQPAPWTGSPKYPVTQPSGGNRTDDAAQAASQQPVAPMAVPQSAMPMPEQQLAAPAQSPMTTPAPKATASKTSAPKAAAAVETKPDPKETARFREDQKRAEEAQKRAEETQKAAEKKAADEKAEADRRAAEEQAIADRKAAEEKAEADKKAAAEKARQDKLDAERAKREAEVARKNADAEKKRQDDLKKHEKTVAEAAARLKQAQAAYQAEVDKKKGGSL
jgi:flagellar biosynthesis GTPase FlhF